MKKLFKIILLIIVVAIIYSIFKNKTEAPPEPVTGDVVYNINVDGRDRTYTVHVPEQYNPSVSTPLVFAFHGGGSNNKNMEKSSDFNARSDKNNFIVVYPLGTIADPKNHDKATWNGGPAGGGYANEIGVDDVKFVREMVRKISLDYKIDSGRIYATGISMGGMMSYRLACEVSDIFSAVAPIASVLALPFEECRPARPIALLHFHGTLDKFIPYNGGLSDSSLPKSVVVGGPYPSVEDSINRFKVLDNTESAGENVYTKGDTNCIFYKAKFGKSDVELCTITDGGHTWPGAENNLGFILSRLLGKISQDVSATDYMWEFFKNH